VVRGTEAAGVPPRTDPVREVFGHNAGRPRGYELGPSSRAAVEGEVTPLENDGPPVRRNKALALRELVSRDAHSKVPRPAGRSRRNQLRRPPGLLGISTWDPDPARCRQKCNHG